MDYSEYYNYLMSLIDPPIGVDSPIRDHGMLLYELWEREFCWLGEYNNDECRANDGKQLREEYLMIFDRTPEYVPQGPCKILEMLIAFALRIDNTVHDWRIGHRPWEWMEMFIDNLGLSQMVDDSIGPHDIPELDARLDVFMSHNLGPMNEGGLFRFKKPVRPNRLDLWGQMNKWIIENF